MTTGAGRSRSLNCPACGDLSTNILPDQQRQCRSCGHTWSGRSWTATVALAEQQNPEDWTWDHCVVCGEQPVHRGLYLLKTDGTVARTAWCDRPACLADRDLGAAFVLPDDASACSSPHHPCCVHCRAECDPKDMHSAACQVSDCASGQTPDTPTV